MKLSQVSVLLAGLFSSVVLAQVEQVIQVGHLLDVRTGNYQNVEIAGLYWHFVDLVWVFIFAFFYLW